MSFLKSRVSGLKKISSKITGNQEKGNLISQRSILSKQADQKLVFSLSKHSLPTFSQLKTLPKFFSPREKRTVRLLIYAIMLSLILLAVNFYYSHSVLVAKTGGTYTEGLVGTPQYINPILSSYNDVDRDLASLIFNGLLKYNDEDDIEPDLAEEFQISPDRKIYTFKLRQGVKWHDGEPLTADDVIFTVSSIQDPEWQSQLKSALDNVQVEKIDDYSLRFILKDPIINFVNSLTFGILPEHLWLTIPAANATLAELNKKPVGTGPFQFTSLTKDKNGNVRTIVLTRNNDYYSDKAYIKELQFKFYGDFETATQALANNNIEGLGLLPKEYQEQLTGNKNLKFYSLSLPQYTAIFFNAKQNEILKNQAIRQALAFAIDRQAILSQSLDQKGVIINGPILPGFVGFHANIKKYAHNPAEAKKLLADDGWQAGGDGLLTKGGATLQITLTTVEKVEYVKAVELIKADWEAIGVSTNIEIIAKERIRPDIIESRNYQALLFGQIIKADGDRISFF